MTENIPPVPPAPQPSGGLSGNQPPYGPSQPFAQSAPPGYGQPPQYSPYPPQQYAHVSTFGPPHQYTHDLSPFGLPHPYTHTAPFGQLRAKSSGFRVAAGIVSIVFGTLLLIPAIAGLRSSDIAFMGLLILLAALGNITCGILLLANQRSRTKWAPVTSMSTAGFALLLGFIGLTIDYYGGPLLVISMLLAAPVLILMGIGLSRENRTA